MDFYDILKEAAKNKKKAETELDGNKRFNLNFRPKKLPQKPKVDRSAIAARLKRKEEEEQKQAAIDEQKRLEVLALRAEQEAAKSAARKRKGPSVSTQHTTESNRERPREDSETEDPPSPPKREKPAKVKKEKPPKKEKYKDYVFKRRHAEEEARSKNLRMQDAKGGQGFSFKQLMDIAAANAGVPKTSVACPDAKIADKCQPNVRLKSVKDGGPPRDAGPVSRAPKGGGRESLSQDGKKQEKKQERIQSKEKSVNGKPVLAAKMKPEKEKSTIVDRKKEQPSSKFNGHTPKSTLEKDRKGIAKGPSNPRPPKSSCFPNTKAIHDPAGIQRERSPHEGRKSGLEKRGTPRGAHQSDSKPGKVRTGTGEKAISAVENGRPSHHPSKRKTGSFGPVKEPARTPNSPEGGRHEKTKEKRKGGWLDSVPGPSEQVINKKQLPHPAKRKGGWLDPVDRSGSGEDISKVVNSLPKNAAKISREKAAAKEAERDQHKAKKGGSSRPNGIVSPKEERMKKASPGPPPKDRVKDQGQSRSKVSRVEALAKPRQGWLDTAEPPSPPRGGGWLGPTRGPSGGKSGGWLGSGKEPSWQSRGGRLLSSEEEEEDSDLDGFIDDEPQENEPASVSSYIKEIFGYDKTRYKDESDYALRSMESSYSEMMKEEARSARIAQREDAEELRKEKEREMKKKGKRR